MNVNDDAYTAQLTEWLKAHMPEASEVELEAAAKGAKLAIDSMLLEVKRQVAKTNTELDGLRSEVEKLAAVIRA